ncbi:unnamed protein product [Amoebophrya sp. A120]|nr:unnamed protein product [Amoebophrya sp. A120]|eukprot:GSA120T00015829001.1
MLNFAIAEHFRIRKDENIVGTEIGCLPNAKQQNLQLGPPFFYEVTERNSAGRAKSSASADRTTGRTADAERDADPEPEDLDDKSNKRRKVTSPERGPTQAAAVSSSSSSSSFSRPQPVLGRSEPHDVLSVGTGTTPAEQVKTSIVRLQAHHPRYLSTDDEEQHTRHAEKPNRWSEDHVLGSSPRETDTTTPLRTAVLHDLLQNTNFFVKSAITSHGVDFVVYATDPINAHGYFLVKCLEKEQLEELKPLDLISYGRIAQHVKKKIYLAFFEEAQADYQDGETAATADIPGRSEANAKEGPERKKVRYRMLETAGEYI